MDVFVTRAKYLAETITLSADFTKILPPGITISGLPTVSVSVETGTDSNPGNLLSGLATVSSGTVAQQKVRQGLPGVVYDLVFSVTGTDGNSYELQTLLAIFPNEGNAVPTWLPILESTQLYPAQLSDSYTTSQISLTSGDLHEILITYSFEDDYRSLLSFLSGDLHETVITYSFEDDYKSSISITAGALTVVLITYTYEEDYKTGFTIISGSLQVVVISYSYEEDYKASLGFVSGTLA